MNHVDFAAINYKHVKEKLRAAEPNIDEATLADTVEGLTDLHDIVEAIIRSALKDEATIRGLKCRMTEMQDRLTRLQDRASKRRQIAKDVMIDTDIKKIEASDFTASIRPGLPALQVLNEDEVPRIYWQPSEPRLNRLGLTHDLKLGAEIAGVTLAESDPVLSVRVL